MQFLLTPSASKRLIAKAVAKQLSQSKAIETGTIVIIAGTTNGYVAEELLQLLNQSQGFSRKRFFRGITTPPSTKTTDTGRLPDESEFPGDVVIEKGQWKQGKTIFDCVDDLKLGDIIVKGANCVNYTSKKAGILIGHPKGGTIVAALQAVIGRRVELILPIGLEKRVSDPIDSIAETLNSPESSGFRLLPVLGKIITEIEALNYLCGAEATLISAGGVCGAEGGIWLNITGSEATIKESKSILEAVAAEPLFTL